MQLTGRAHRECVELDRYLLEPVNISVNKRARARAPERERYTQKDRETQSDRETERDRERQRGIH